MDVGGWLRGLGLSQYEEAFRDNDIDAGLLPTLTADDLRELGITSLGHRKRLLAAIVALAPQTGLQAPAPPAPASPGPQAERRQLTVMFVDLVGSTALSARLDPEDLRELIGAYHRCVAAGVGRHGGFVAKYLGDGVLAYFGYPRAHEDDAERAIRAGLELVTAVRRIQAPVQSALRVRIGVATGLVVVGDLLGSGAAQEQAVVGETPNLAARLQGLAEPDSVVIAAGTRRLVGDLFECVDLGAVEAKGFPEPVRAYRVLGPGTAESRFEALHGALTPVVGREEEIGLLLRCWEQARAGAGRVVLLSGEPGVGKSRLLAALQERLGEEPHVRPRYFCSPHHQASALHPVITQLEHAAGFARGDSPEVRLAKLEALLAPTSPSVEDVALLAELLSIPGGDRYPAPRFAPRRKRERTFDVLLRQLEALARREPVLMTFEDVHWIDPSSRELLDLAIERAARLPVLLLITMRPEFAPPWTGRPQVTALVLNHLDQRAGAALVRQVAGGETLPDELVAEIVERADGVPLFVEELTKAVLEAGEGDPVARTVGAAAPAGLAVPATLHASLLARLDRLDPAARQVAQVGAAIGREFPHELLAAVAGLREDELAAALEQLAGAGLVFRHGAPPRAGYLFKHALVRDAAYGTLLRDRRRRLHGAVAHTLEERFPELAETVPELIAHHLAEAGETEPAAGYWLAAGRRSAERSADREAVRHLRLGLDTLATLPSSEARDRLELDFQLALGPPLVATSGYTSPEVAAAFERAGALCEALGDADRLITALFGLFQYRLVGGDCRAARDLALRCRVLAERGGDPVHRLLSHRVSGAVATAQGMLPEARAELEALATLHDPDRDRSLVARYSADPRATGLAFLTLVLWVMGFPEQARRAGREAIRSAAELEHVSTVCHVRLYAGAQLAELLRDDRAAEAHADAVMALAGEHHLPTWQGRGAVLRGWALGRNGRVEEGLDLVRRGIGGLDALGTAFHRPRYLTILAELHARLGDLPAALRVAAEAWEQVRRSGEALWQADLHRVEGELRHRAGAPAAEVGACFAAALGLARQQGAKSFELRAATSLARLRYDQGKRGEARDILEPVYGWFTEGFDTSDLREAKGLLDGLR